MRTKGLFGCLVLACVATLFGGTALAEQGDQTSDIRLALQGPQGQISKGTLTATFGTAYYGFFSGGEAVPRVHIQVGYDYGSIGSVLHMAVVANATPPRDPNPALVSSGIFVGYSYRFRESDGLVYPSIGAGVQLCYLGVAGDKGFEGTGKMVLAVTKYFEGLPREQGGLLFEVSIGPFGTRVDGETRMGIYTDVAFGARFL